MRRQTAILVPLFCLAGFLAPSAEAQHCRIVTLVEDDLWLWRSNKAEPTRLTFNGERKTAAALSPDGSMVAFGLVPPTHGSDVEIRISDTAGRALARISVAYSEHQLRRINTLGWLDSQTFWAYGDVGPHGGYLVVWKLDDCTHFATETKSVGVLGGGCRLANDRALVACMLFGGAEDFVAIYDTSKKDPGHETRFFDRRYPLVAVEGSTLSFVARSQYLAWNQDGKLLVAFTETEDSLLATAIRQVGDEWRIVAKRPLQPDSKDPVVGFANLSDGKWGLLTASGALARFELEESRTTDPVPLTTVPALSDLPEPIEPRSVLDWACRLE